MKKIMNYLFIGIIAIMSLLVLVLTTKGDKGTPIAYQYGTDRSMGGPFESSNSSARYALTEAIVERGSFEYTEKQAKFSSPDLVYHNGKFYSLFTPGISFIGIPFYMLGKYIGYPQLVSYSGMALFSFVNMFLIAYIAKRFGANFYSGLLGGFLFLFATNALAYTQSFTQHIASTTLLLLAIINALGKRSIVNNILFGFIFGLALLIDIPNGFLLLPLGIYIFLKHFHIRKEMEQIAVSVRFTFFAILIGLLPVIALFGWYNYQTTGSATLLGQSIGRTTYEEVRTPTAADLARQAEEAATEEDSSLPFNTRKQIEGMYTLLISDERSWIYYSPIVLLGLFGFYNFYKEKRSLGIINSLVAVIVMNILLYSMFGDPWGGWSFGARYLIPAAGVLSIFLGIAFYKYGKYLLFSLLFTLLAFYSIFVSISGAVTTSAIPPKQEAIHLQAPIPYTYERNIDLVKQNQLSALVYNLFLEDKIPAYTYVIGIAGTLSILGVVLQSMAIAQTKREEVHHGKSK